MKIYSFIVIDKSNMRELHHFPTADRAATSVFGRQRVADNFIFVKNEEKVVDLKALQGYGGDPCTLHKKLVEILLDA